MNKRAWVIVAATLALTACATVTKNNITWSGASLFTAPNPINPNVYVANDTYIVVDQEPILITQSDDGNQINWTLGSLSAYYFPDDNRHKGIVWERPHPTNLNCSAIDAGKTFQCTFKRSPKKKYPYTITLTKDGATFLTSDPTVMID